MTPRPGRTPRAWLLVFTAVIVVAATMRLSGIDYNFDGDEIFSVQLASGSTSQVLDRALGDKPHPPLHYLLLHVWVGMFGPSEASARAMSVVLSLGATGLCLAML